MRFAVHTVRHRAILSSYVVLPPITVCDVNPHLLLNACHMGEHAQFSTR